MTIPKKHSMSVNMLQSHIWFIKEQSQL